MVHLNDVIYGCTLFFYSNISFRQNILHSGLGLKFLILHFENGMIFILP